MVLSVSTPTLTMLAHMRWPTEKTTLTGKDWTRMRK
jgi:hypothetical protein